MGSAIINERPLQLVLPLISTYLNFNNLIGRGGTQNFPWEQQSEKKKILGRPHVLKE